MAQLDFAQIMLLSRRWWWLLVLVPIITGFGGYAFGSVQEARYSATVTLMGRPVQGSDSVNYDEILTAQSLVSTYAQLVDTRLVLDPVVTELGLPYDIDHIRANLTVNATEQSQILRISVTDSEPQRASDIVNSVAVNLIDYVANMEARVGDNAGDATFVFVVAENAIAPKSPYTPRISYLIWVGVIGGFLVLGIVGVFAAVRSNAVNADVEGQQSVQASTLPSVLHQRRRAPTISRFAGRRSEPSKGPIVTDVSNAGASKRSIKS